MQKNPMDEPLTPKQLENISFEMALELLEKIVVTLEMEENTLEASLELFERGQTLAQHCTKLLDQAELRVKQLSDGVLKDFDPNQI